MELTSVSTKGQIVIPGPVRKRFKLKPGSRLVLFERGDELVLKREADAEKILAAADDVAWNAFSFEGLKDIWDNEEDERVWKQYV